MKKPTPQQLESLRAKWDLQGEIKFHRRVANFVYFTNKESQEVVLRLTEPSHRSLDEIKSELDWMNYLTQKGLLIAQPILGVDHSFIQETEPSESDFYFAALFKKALGTPLPNKNLSYAFVEKWGSYLGKMHRLTKEYRPSNGIQIRQQWDQDASLIMALRSVGSVDKTSTERLNELMDWMRTLPKDFESYGLIHCDFHQGNFHVQEDEITAFDFDDSCYHWFAYDMVPAMNSIRSANEEADLGLLDKKINEHFLKGYCRENKIDQVWIERLSLFEKYRAVLMYHWAQTCLNENVFDDFGIEWAKKRMPQLKKIFEDPLEKDPKFQARARKLIIYSEKQTAELFENSSLKKSYKISTSAKGLSCEVGSNCTPIGKLRIASKIGHGFQSGAVFTARTPSGEIWCKDNPEWIKRRNEDLVLTRILWLEGTEEGNQNTLSRFIYLHGTNQEQLLGSPASHGCIRFSNADVIEVFDLLEVGCEIEII